MDSNWIDGSGVEFYGSGMWSKKFGFSRVRMGSQFRRSLADYDYNSYVKCPFFISNNCVIPVSRITVVANSMHGSQLVAQFVE